jgi:outer membrane lipoprotein-sorting protein
LDDVEYEEEGENFDLESGVIDKKKRWSFRKSVRDVLKIQKKRNVSDLAIELDTGLLTHDNL